MKLKSLAEIAFDGHQAFAGEDRKFKQKFAELSSKDQLMFERIASRVYAEVLLRQNPGVNDLPMPDLDNVEVK